MMPENNMFQTFPVQNSNYGYDNPPINWNGRNNMNMGVNQNPYVGGPIANRNQGSFSSIPVRVVFSPEQIAPQDIPTNGTPAIFPLNDGSKIVVRSMLGNGLFDEKVYVLQQNSQQQASEFDQVMMRLSGIENSLNQVLSDLYGSKSQSSQEVEGKKNE